MELFREPEVWTALLTLTALEIVLGIDNIVFISILSDRLPAEQRARARTTGLLLAMFMRIALLFSIGWIMSLTAPLFEVNGHPFSGRDLILIGGGLFLGLGAVPQRVHLGQIALLQRVDQVAGRRATSRVEAHIQRPGLREAEPTLRVG